MPSTAHRPVVSHRPKRLVRRWKVLSLLPSTTVSRVTIEKIATGDLYISDWNSLPPTPLAGWNLKEHVLSLADPNEYSISKSSGPDDSFFRLNGHSHKYSNLKGGRSSSSVGGGGRRGAEGTEKQTLEEQQQRRVTLSKNSPSGRSYDMFFFFIFSQSKYPDHQHFPVLQTLFYSSL